MHARSSVALLVALVACGSDPLPPLTVHLGSIIDGDGLGRATVGVEITAGARDVVIDPDGEQLVVEASVAPNGFGAALDGVPAEGNWLRTRPIVAPITLHLTATDDATARVTIISRGAPVGPARVERSLAWTDPALLDDKATIGLRRLMTTIADDNRGGRLLDAWLRRFATTSHSERFGPAQLADQIAAAQGANPSAWDLDALPFTVTAIYNRIDLGPRDGGCGQLRVALASTDPIYAPFDLIFLFRQQPDPDDDVSPDGLVHCLGTARRWAVLSALEGDAWLVAARSVLDAGIKHDRFLLAESVELTVSPWEWRQWTWVPNADPQLPRVFDNPPLFQTIDPALVNPGAAMHDAFVAFVEANAEGLAARTVEIPDAFRSQSQRVAPGAKPAAIDLAGVTAATLASYPTLAHELGAIGCPQCHTDNADFQQVSAQRVFSPFTTLELAARTTRLDVMTAGDAVPIPPFGPLQ